MLYSYIKLALRHMRRDKVYASINIFGLAVGLAVSILILLYVRFEMSFDNYHENGDRIYRITQFAQFRSESSWNASLQRGVGPMIDETIPDVEAVTRLMSFYSRDNTIQRDELGVDDIKIVDKRMFLADPSFLDMFTVEFIRGNSTTALENPSSLILTESFAREYFGDVDPMGSHIVSKNKEKIIKRTVSGVIRDLPLNSTISFDYLGSVSSIDDAEFQEGLWSHSNGPTYVLLADGAIPDTVASKIKGLVKSHRRIFNPDSYLLDLEPLSDIHLKTAVETRSANAGDLRLIYMLSTIAILVLVLVVINYSNLAIARTVHRSNEIGIRKVVGARKSQLAFQFISESIVLALTGMILAFVLVEILLPYFNALIGRELQINLFGSQHHLLLALSITVILGIICGVYPAFIQTTRKPVDALNGGWSGPKGERLRQSLVVFQFAASTILILAATAVYQQMGYIQATRLNIGDDQIVTFIDRDGQIRPRYAAFKAELLSQTAISHVSTGDIPGWEHYSSESYLDEDDVRIRFFKLYGGEDYFEMFGIEIIRGRDFTEADYQLAKVQSLPGASQNVGVAVLVNEAGVELLELDDPIGFEIPYSHDIIVGVVKNFYLEPLNNPVAPLKIPPSSGFLGRIIIRLKAGRIAEGMAAIKDVWNDFAPGFPLNIAFLDDEMDRAYKAELRMGQIFGWFAGLAILIACLGLFGLAAFTAERRTKEIGIRKVVGASVSDIIILLGREFVALVIIANLIAWPMAWYGMTRWLQNFAYHLDLSIVPFVVVGLAVTGIAITTVTFQAIKAATAKPVEALRYE